MSAKFFVDSNVLVYAYNEGEPARQRLAQHLLRQPERMISTQVLQEFCNVLRRKVKFDWFAIANALAETQTNFHGRIHINTPETIERALRYAERYQLSFYDGLIVAAALEADCERLYSEDLHAGLVVEKKLTILDPFAGAKT